MTPRRTPAALLRFSLLAGVGSLVVACGAPPEEPFRTSRTVFNPPVDLWEEFEDAAEEWSEYTGVEVRISDEPGAVPVRWDELDERYSGYTTAYYNIRTNEWEGATIDLDWELAGDPDRLWRTVRHEMGHVLRWHESQAHTDDADTNCLMRHRGQLNAQGKLIKRWCRSDIDFICETLACNTGDNQ